MKKSISAILIAALMLFAFTACEQQMPNIPLDGDNDIAKVTVVDTPVFYAGSTQNTGTATINIERVGGKTTTDVSAILEVTLGNTGRILPGTNQATVSFGSISTSGYEYEYPVTVDALSIESLQVTVDEDTLTDVSEVTDVTVESIYGVYSDGTRTASLQVGSQVSRAFSADGNSIIYTLPGGTYSNDDVTFSVAVERAVEPVVPATQWVVIAEQDSEDFALPEIGDDISEAGYTSDITIDFGTSVSSVRNSIHVYALTADDVVVSEITDFTIYGLPTSSAFNQMEDGSPVTSYTYTVEANSYADLEGITFTDNTGDITVEDGIDLASIEVTWAADTEYVATVGTMPEDSDFAVEVTTLSGADLSNSVALDVVYPHAIYSENVGDYIYFTVTVTYSENVVDAVQVRSKTTVVAAGN